MVSPQYFSKSKGGERNREAMKEAASAEFIIKKRGEEESGREYVRIRSFLAPLFTVTCHRCSCRNCSPTMENVPLQFASRLRIQQKQGEEERRNECLYSRNLVFIYAIFANFSRSFSLSPSSMLLEKLLANDKNRFAAKEIVHDL